MENPNVDDLPADQATFKDAGIQPAPPQRRWLHYATEPHILYPAIAILVRNLAQAPENGACNYLPGMLIDQKDEYSL